MGIITPKDFIEIELNLNRLFVEKFSANNDIKFNSKDSSEEIFFVNESLQKHIFIPNSLFFTELFKELKFFIKNDRSWRKLIFNGWLDEDSALNFMVLIVIKSLILTSLNSASSSISSGYVDRRDAVSSFYELSVVFRFLFDYDLVVKVFKRALLFMMGNESLDTFVEKSYSRLNSFKTVVLVRFKIPYNFPIESRLKLYIAFRPYRLIADDYLISSSFVSLYYLYKPSKSQKKINRFNSHALISMSSKGFFLDKNLYSIIKEHEETT